MLVVAGGPASGKTTASRAAAAYLSATLVSQDDYYERPDVLPEPDRWEDPLCWNLARLAADLRMVRDGQAVIGPAGSREARDAGITERRLEPTAAVFCEGILALCTPQLRAAADVAVWVEVPEQELVRRRLERAERSGQVRGSDTVEWVTGQMLSAYRRHAALQRPYADVVVDGMRPVTEVAAALVRLARAAPART